MAGTVGWFSGLGTGCSGNGMKLLIDMNLSPDWVQFLSGTGVESIHWSAIGAALRARASRWPCMSRIGRRSDRPAPTWHSRKLHSRQIISCQGCTSSMKKLFAGAERAGTSPGIGMSAYIRPNSRPSRRNVNRDRRIPMSGDGGGSLWKRRTLSMNFCLPKMGLYARYPRRGFARVSFLNQRSDSSGRHDRQRS